MKRGGYIAWVNNDPFWHPTLASAQRRVNFARLRGKDTFIYRQCYAVNIAMDDGSLDDNIPSVPL
jgi:hypothetical protein